MKTFFDEIFEPHSEEREQKTPADLVQPEFSSFPSEFRRSFHFSQSFISIGGFFPTANVAA
jgi:hypothetical protein